MGDTRTFGPRVYSHIPPVFSPALPGEPIGFRRSPFSQNFINNTTGVICENQITPRNRLPPSARRHRRRGHPGDHPGESVVPGRRDHGGETTEAGEAG